MIFKNIPNEAIKLSDLIEIEDKQIVSSNLFDSNDINITVFSFADLENISEESYSGETLFYVIQGNCFIKIGEEKITLAEGDIYKLAKETLHEVHALEPFKMLQISLK